MDTRKIIDFAQDGNAVGVREALYSSIWDRVHAAIEAKKQEIAQNLVAQEEYEGPGDDEDDWDEEDEDESPYNELDEEQLDEISDKLRGSFIRGAAKKAIGAANAAGRKEVETGMRATSDRDVVNKNVNRVARVAGHGSEIHKSVKAAVSSANAAGRKEMMSGRNSTKDRDTTNKHMGNIVRATMNKEEYYDIEEAAKWRRSSAAEPNPMHDPEVASFDKSATGSPIRSKANTPSKPGSISTRKPAQVASQGPRAGMATKRSQERLKSNIRYGMAKEAYHDDDEDPDVRIADRELKKRGVTLPKVKGVDPEKDMSKLAKRTPKEKDED